MSNHGSRIKKPARQPNNSQRAGYARRATQPATSFQPEGPQRNHNPRQPDHPRPSGTNRPNPRDHRQPHRPQPQRSHAKGPRLPPEAQRAHRKARAPHQAQTKRTSTTRSAITVTPRHRTTWPITDRATPSSSRASFSPQHNHNCSAKHTHTQRPEKPTGRQLVPAHKRSSQHARPLPRRAQETKPAPRTGTAAPRPTNRANRARQRH